jgi:hypothetical protein
MITDVNLLAGKFDELEALLSTYSELTNRLSAADIESIDEADAILNEREGLIGKMKAVQPQITELINKQTPEKAAAIRKMLTGDTIMADFSDDEKVIQAKAINLRSLQSDIMQKENSNRMRFKRKYDEIRGELEELQKDKKKLNFYQNAIVSDPEDSGVTFSDQG